jgi:PII-like signaling protein
MLAVGPAKKVSIYVGEDHQYRGQALYAAVLDYLFDQGVSGANVVRGIAGFGVDHHLHTTRALALTENLPVKIQFIESPEKIEELLPTLKEMVGNSLIELQNTLVSKPSEATHKQAHSDVGLPIKKEGKAKLMRIYVGENDKWRDKPLYQALVEAMRDNEIAGVTLYKGILGYGANRRIHQEKTLSLSSDPPVLLSVIDTEEKVRAFFPVLEDMLQQGLVVLSNVDVIKYTHNYKATEQAKAVRQ